MSKLPAWIELPAEVWERILSFVDGKSLIRASETCTKLNDIIDLHPTLISSIWVKLNCAEEKLTEGLEAIKRSRRKYRQLFVNQTKPQWFDNDLFLEVLTKLGQTVTALATDNVKFASRKKFVDVLRLFPLLHRVQLKMITMDEADKPETKCLDEFVHFPHLCDLYMVEYSPWFCDILSLNTTIKRIESYIIKWTEDDPVPFENLVYRQTELKKLRLGIFRSGRLFQEDRSREVNFQLDRLLLNGAFYANKENILSFVQTQKKLKKVRINLLNEHEVKLDRTLFFNEILVHILTKLPELNSFGVHQDKFKFPDLEFIRNLPPNKLVENLKVEGESVDIFSALVNVLPNIKKLIYDANIYERSVPEVATINRLQHVEHLVLDKFLVDALNEVRLAKLRSFEFIARRMSLDFSSNLKIFMQRHPALTRLRIGVVKFMANIAINKENCEDIAACLPKLESLNLQNFDDINANVVFLVNQVRNLRCLEVNKDQFKLLTSDTFDECSYNGVTVSIGK